MLECRAGAGGRLAEQVTNGDRPAIAHDRIPDREAGHRHPDCEGSEVLDEVVEGSLLPSSGSTSGEIAGQVRDSELLLAAGVGPLAAVATRGQAPCLVVLAVAAVLLDGEAPESRVDGRVEREVAVSVEVELLVQLHSNIVDHQVPRSRSGRPRGAGSR